jgi:uncharacterized protein
MDPLSLDFVLISSVIIFFAYFVKGITGFGAGPIRNSLWLFFTDIKFAAPAGIIFAILGNSRLLWGCHSCINKRLLIWLGGGSLIGNIVGSYFLITSPSGALSIFFGVFLLFYGALSFIKPLKKHNSRNITNFVVGIISGTVGGIFGAGSAVIIALWIDRHGLQKEAFRGTLVLIYLLGNIIRVSIYALAGLYNTAMLEFVVLMLPAFVLGISLGNWICPKTGEKAFKKILSAVFASIGLLLIVMYAFI